MKAMKGKFEAMLMAHDASSECKHEDVQVKWRRIESKEKTPKYIRRRFKNSLHLTDEVGVHFKLHSSLVFEIHGYAFIDKCILEGLEKMQFGAIQSFCRIIHNCVPVLCEYSLIPFSKQHQPPDALKMHDMKNMVRKYMRDDGAFLDELLSYGSSLRYIWMSSNDTNKIKPEMKIKMHEDAIRNLENEIAQMKMNNEVQED